MILNNFEQVVVELNGMLEYDGASRFDRLTAQKGLDLLSSLRASDGPEKWIEYGGHLTIVMYHAPRFGIDGKRAFPQVYIDPRVGSVFCEVRYLLPTENRPWKYVSGYAEDIPAATTMIIDALGRCKQREEHLLESLA